MEMFYFITKYHSCVLSSSQVTALQGRFSEVHHLLASHGITANSVDAVLFDLGASSMQFDTAARGFSINKDGPLDMRMDSDRSRNV